MGWVVQYHDANGTMRYSHVAGEALETFIRALLASNATIIEIS